MATTLVEVLTAEQAQERYDRLVRQIGDLERFRAQRERYDLDGEDAVRYEELRDLEFLLRRD